jgi:hypothetical protein
MCCCYAYSGMLLLCLFEPWFNGCVLLVYFSRRPSQLLLLMYMVPFHSTLRMQAWIRGTVVMVCCGVQLPT